MSCATEVNYGQVRLSAQIYPRKNEGYPQDTHNLWIEGGHQDPLLIRMMRSVTWL